MELIGSSTVWNQVLQRVKRVAPLPASVLVTGETGTGKELVARAIHEASGRKGPFIAVNCAMLTRELAESRLFGYLKGAFTGATTSRYGLIHSAHNGTLFLDEVGELPPDVQSMLLRVLQDHIVSRLGDDEQTIIDFRLICATHQPVEGLEGFRRDFFERVAEYRLQLPPLRARGRDVLELARHILSRDPSLLQLGVALERSAEAALLDHTWPGNVRELATCLRSVAIDDGVLDGRAIRRWLGHSNPDPEPILERTADTAADQAFPLQKQAPSTLLELLSEPRKAAWLAEHTGLSHRTVLRQIATLLAAGKVEVVGAGKDTHYRAVQVPESLNKAMEPISNERPGEERKVEQVCEERKVEQVCEERKVEQVCEERKVEQGKAQRAAGVRGNLRALLSLMSYQHTRMGETREKAPHVWSTS